MLPMEGVLAVDLSRVLAGPSVTRLMVELGARVVKVETPPDGDASRSLPYRRDGRSGYFIQQNRGKESLCVDLRTEAGRAVLTDLLRRADVLVENYRPGVLDEMGFGWSVLQELNPRLILCSVTALGYGGPLSHRGGYDTVGAALSGIASVSGPPGGPPMLPSAAIGDTTTGVHGFAGVAAALFNRERTGRGDWVQVSLLDTYVSCHEINLQAWSGSGGTVVPGPGTATVCPIGMFRCGGSWLFLACVSPPEWGRLAAAMGRPELADDPRYATNEDRVRHRDEVLAAVNGWLDAVGDPDEVVERLDAAGVVAAKVLTVPEAARHPHLLARRAVRTVPDEVWGEITIPGVPIRFASVPDDRALEARNLGADNASVLTGLLGYDPVEVEALETGGVLRSAERD
jgi:crotonobetainyl-CoA:carnitine CoA-transferase CaiB-like acyl-CoA transferase